MRKLKSVIPVLALVVMMAVPVQAAPRFTPDKCWCGGEFENLGFTGTYCKKGCNQPVYNYYHWGVLHTTQGYFCLNGHLNN